MNRLKLETRTEQARAHGINLRKDFHRLRFEEVDTLHELARKNGYRKPRGYCGSLGRAYFNYLNKAL